LARAGQGGEDVGAGVGVFLNQHLPTKVRDAILLNHMRIKP
jgi:hypothetical protein